MADHIRPDPADARSRSPHQHPDETGRPLSPWSSVPARHHEGPARRRITDHADEVTAHDLLADLHQPARNLYVRAELSLEPDSTSAAPRVQHELRSCGESDRRPAVTGPRPNRQDGLFRRNVNDGVRHTDSSSRKRIRTRGIAALVTAGVGVRFVVRRRCTSGRQQRRTGRDSDNPPDWGERGYQLL